MAVVLNEGRDDGGWEVKNLPITKKIVKEKSRFFGRKLRQNDIIKISE